MELVEPQQDLPTWTFLTNHAHVLIALDRDPHLRQRVPRERLKVIWASAREADRVKLAVEALAAELAAQGLGGERDAGTERPQAEKAASHG